MRTPGLESTKHLEHLRSGVASLRRVFLQAPGDAQAAGPDHTRSTGHSIRIGKVGHGLVSTMEHGQGAAAQRGQANTPSPSQVSESSEEAEMGTWHSNKLQDFPPARLGGARVLLGWL